MVSNRIGTAYSYCARICARAQMHSFENAFHGFSCFHEYQNEFIFSGMHLFSLNFLKELVSSTLTYFLLNA